MRLNDTYLRSIAYLGCARPGSETEIDSHGTAFLVEWQKHRYLVTAAHVAVDFQGGPVAVRLNRRDNGLGGIQHLDEANWFWHPDDRIDVAVMPFEAEPWARVRYFEGKHIAGDFKVGTKNFGTGDLAYVVGIFQKMRGKEKNVPVVHTATIGSMGAGEKLFADDWRAGGKKGDLLEVEGYLVQVPTLRESSGSPVFVRRTLELDGVHERDDKGMLHPVRAWTYGSVWLLGVWHGMWEEQEKGRTIGTGMGLCIPGQRLIETLDQPKLKAMRHSAAESCK